MADATETTSPPQHSTTDEVAHLKAHVARLETLLVMQHDAVREAEVRHAHRSETLDHWVARTEARIAEVSAENAHLLEEVEALRGSTSWKVTAPLRWIRRTLSPA